MTALILNAVSQQFFCSQCLLEDEKKTLQGKYYFFFNFKSVNCKYLELKRL